MKQLVALIVVAVIGVGCSGPSTADPLDGRDFLSTAVTQGGEPFALVDGTRVRLSFGDGNIGANAGCNTIGGTYRLASGVLDVEGGAMTEMGCDPERHDQDAWLAEFLASDPRATVNGNELVLTSGGTEMKLLDTEVAEPDLRLTGTTWTVTSVFAGDAVSTPPLGATATFEFAADGTVAVETGCNTGGGRYEVDGDRLRFVDVATTDVGCDGAAGELEDHVVALLAADEVTFEIDAGSLTMLVGGEGLGLTGR